MVFLRRCAQIAVEQHDIRDGLRIGDDIAYERRAVGGISWCPSHFVSSVLPLLCLRLHRRRINGPSPTALAAHSTTTTLVFCRLEFPRPTGQSGRATPLT